MLYVIGKKMSLELVGKIGMFKEKELKVLRNMFMVLKCLRLPCIHNMNIQLIS